MVILCYPKIDHEKNYVYFWMPYSLLFVAKPLIEQGIPVLLFDGNLKGEKEWIELLDEHIGNVLMIGFSIMTGGGQIGHALHLAGLARGTMPDVPLVFGGPHVNVLPEQTLQHPLVDFVLTGPGQTSMLAFVNAFNGKFYLADVPGLIMLDAQKIERGPNNPAKVEQLGSYPWDFIDVNSYIRDDPTVASRTLNYISSQGCIYKCRFCYELSYQRRYSKIPAGSLHRDIRHLAKKYEINGIKFYDAAFFINARQTCEFVRLLLSEGPDIKWAASINPKDVLRLKKRDPNIFTDMGSSGCTRLLMGVESGSNRVLQHIVDKEITREEIFDAARYIAAHGILGSYTFIIGFPGETESEKTETYEFIEQLRTLDPKPEIRVHIFAPYPGTPLFDEAVKYGYAAPLTLAEWSHYDYYESQTPWTKDGAAAIAREKTEMRLTPATNAP